MEATALYHTHLQDLVTKLHNLAGDHPPQVMITLGSGLGGVVAALPLQDKRVVAYSQLPHLPKPTVAGHAGQLVLGRLAGKPVALMQGRFHWYEGHEWPQVLLLQRALARCGARQLVVTNAAGCLVPAWPLGQFMRLTDHLNLTGHSPLRGPNLDELGPRFVDMSAAYCPQWGQRFDTAVAQANLPLQHGVYAGVGGPNYETPAEIRLLQTLGAQAVGMSTVGEVLAARHMGVSVLGLSCLTNYGAGLAEGTLSHSEVTEQGQAGETQATLAQLLVKAIETIA